MAAPAAGIRVPVEAMTFDAAPSAQIDIQSGGRALDGDFFPRRLAQRALDEQVAAFGESKRSEIYAHRATKLSTNASIVPRRSTAAESGA